MTSTEQREQKCFTAQLQQTEERRVSFIASAGSGGREETLFP
jgi:hypothetical protein